MTTPWNLVADGFSFPTSLACADDGTLYVAEAGLPFGGAAPGGVIWQVTPDGVRSRLLDSLHPPVNGLTYHEGHLYISEGGHPARISRLNPKTGDVTVLLDQLPGPGNYHTNMVAFGPDGWLYFGQGAMTNLGIVGLDAYELGWLRRLPHQHDLPGYAITLTGVNATTANPLVDDPDAQIATGSFQPFGTSCAAGQRIEPTLPATSAIMRCRPDGSHLELVAWGVRNAFALGFLPDGRLIAVDQGADDRGSRPIGNAPDLLFEVHQRKWYGWPDFIGAIPVTDAQFTPTRGPAPTFLLANHDELPTPEKALLAFPPHVAAVKFAIAPDDFGAYGGQLFIALFGDEAPMTAPADHPRVGRSLARIDPADWSLHQVATGPLRRPIDVKIVAGEQALYVLDFGDFEMTEQGVSAVAQSGRIWRFDLLA